VSDATPLCHDAFVKTLQHFEQHGATRNERDLATMALNIYSLVPTHPLVVHFVNQFTLKATAA